VYSFSLLKKKVYCKQSAVTREQHPSHIYHDSWSHQEAKSSDWPRFTDAFLRKCLVSLSWSLTLLHIYGQLWDHRVGREDPRWFFQVFGVDWPGRMIGWPAEWILPFTWNWVIVSSVEREVALGRGSCLNWVIIGMFVRWIYSKQGWFHAGEAAKAERWGISPLNEHSGFLCLWSLRAWDQRIQLNSQDWPANDW
jgi:hypothetical protein